MPSQSAIERISATPELLDFILRNFKPISEFHQDATREEERAEQIRYGGPSDAHTLSCAALVCKKWSKQAFKFLWRDISFGELEIFINKSRPPSVRTCPRSVTA